MKAAQMSTATRALAYARIPFFLVLKAMIVRFFGSKIRFVPEVRFRRLPEYTLAQAIVEKEYLGKKGDGWSCIELDLEQLAEYCFRFSVPLVSILAHELVHIYLGECGHFRVKHGKRFLDACDELISRGCPVDCDSFEVGVVYPAAPCDWRRSMAIEVPR